MWLIAMIAPPTAGTCSWPVTVNRVPWTKNSVLTAEMTGRYTGSFMSLSLRLDPYVGGQSRRENRALLVVVDAGRAGTLSPAGRRFCVRLPGWHG